MDSLSDTIWDVTISGTGLPQSLLALSGKKILHVDRNDYYGGLEAALSLQEAEAWAERLGGGNTQSPIQNITVNRVDQGHASESGGTRASQLAFSRAYSLSLSPQVIYTRSNILPALVSSKVYRQLDFLAVGSWWLYDDTEQGDTGEWNASLSGKESPKSRLRKIPGGREDVFADETIDRRSMMSLMKFLKLAADPEACASAIDDWSKTPFSIFLESQYKIPHSLQEPLLALALSPSNTDATLTKFALPNIHRHLTSIGIFGPGFGAVIPKWGGLAEISQVACRASAVGGGVYVLKKGVVTIEQPNQQKSGGSTPTDPVSQLSLLTLDEGEKVRTRWVLGSKWDLPPIKQEEPRNEDDARTIACSITIVSGKLSTLFPSSREGAPPPASAIVVFPIRTLLKDIAGSDTQAPESKLPPVYLMIHSSDTGECPEGQCIVYGYIFHSATTEAHAYLQNAVKRLLLIVGEDPRPVQLWSMHYDRSFSNLSTLPEKPSTTSSDSYGGDHALKLPDVAPGLALGDHVLKDVREAYRRIMGDNDDGFMIFEDREGAGEEADNSE
ncbi:Rab proteins geranylgeranyltransferase component A [Lecanora helva]